MDVAGNPDLARFRDNLQGEVDSAALYRAMAAHESNEQLAEVYKRLASVEETHAAFWRSRLAAAGANAAAPPPGWRTRLLGLTEEQAQSTAHQVMSNRTTALSTLAREELGILCLSPRSRAPSRRPAPAPQGWSAGNSA